VIVCSQARKTEQARDNTHAATGSVRWKEQDGKIVRMTMVRAEQLDVADFG